LTPQTDRRTYQTHPTQYPGHLYHHGPSSSSPFCHHTENPPDRNINSMGFGTFKRHLADAAKSADSGTIPGVLSVKKGDSDGEVTIKYSHDSLPRPVNIQALALDVSEYPDGNSFLVWTDPDAPAPVVSAVSSSQDYLSGLPITTMITKLVAHLANSLSATSGEDVEETEDAAVSEDGYISDDAAFDPDQQNSPLAQAPMSHFKAHHEADLQRIRRDLRQVSNAGYKVGLIDGFGARSTTGIASISVRVSKLGITEQAMVAWDLEPTDYVVLLLRYCGPTYPSLEKVLELPPNPPQVQFRLGKCNQFKPTWEQAVAAFNTQQKWSQQPDPQPANDTAAGKVVFEKLFLSNSMDSFMNDCFISLVKIRRNFGYDWDRANQYRLEAETFPAGSTKPWSYVKDDNMDILTAPEHAGSLGSKQVSYPDHLLDDGSTKEGSLPLVAMQFAMRYFVRCTEYCLRCHRRLDKDFEALRPYVCSDPLCLFQYMAMGLGPCVEHEILNQPCVVDLLVSLCYAATFEIHMRPANYMQKTSVPQLPIRSLPAGLRFTVPNQSALQSNAAPAQARLTDGLSRLVFEDATGWDSVKGHMGRGQWIAFREPTNNNSSSQTQILQHAKILGVDHCWKTITIQMMTVTNLTASQSYTIPYAGPAATTAKATNLWFDNQIVDVFPYDTDFDGLDDVTKGSAMRLVLDTLPSVLELQQWIVAHPNQTLRSMERVSSPALSLLSWIVGSNRSCILQIDPPTITSETKSTKSGKKSQAPLPVLLKRGRNRERERIPGLDGWVQFLFAQGAPDRELRFKRELRKVATREKHPTIFAWHGSYLGNWHSIIRTGLDFKTIANGRANGHGVYFSPHFNTSLGYARAGHPWPNSILQIDNCLSLVEIINSTSDFVSTDPHYVVAQPDWHQCRYLIVRKTGHVDVHSGLPPQRAPWKVNTGAYGVGGLYAPVQPASVLPPGPAGGGAQIAFVEQDLTRQVFGPDGTALQIPQSAIPQRTLTSAPSSPARAKRKYLEIEIDGDDTEDDMACFTWDDEEDGGNPVVARAPVEGTDGAAGNR
jgi:ubiquitin-conjugating enzyme E2 Q